MPFATLSGGPERALRENRGWRRAHRGRSLNELQRRPTHSKHGILTCRTLLACLYCRYISQKYGLDETPGNNSHLSRALTKGQLGYRFHWHQKDAMLKLRPTRFVSSGTEDGIFEMPKGASGKVKLAPKAKKPTSTGKEVSPVPACQLLELTSDFRMASRAERTAGQEGCRPRCKEGHSCFEGDQGDQDEEGPCCQGALANAGQARCRILRIAYKTVIASSS